jgi:single-strand DNA-binding protein
MASFNKVILVGNLTRDPELRFTSKGLAIAKLGLAVNRTWKSETGESKEEVTFVDVDAFGKQAETIGQYLKKGRPILIEGRLRLDQWDDKQTGQKRSRLGVVMESFQFLDSGNRGEAGASRPAAAPAAPAAAADAPPPPAAEAAEPEQDDVPF